MTFLKLSPVLEVVTNIDLEHLDYYSNINQIKETFLEFINKIPFYGAAILCLDNQNIADILPDVQKRILTYGMTSQADVSARSISYKGLESQFDVYVGNDFLGNITLALPGEHNIYNALATVTVGLELEIPFATIAAAMKSFTGVQRRLQIKGERRNILVIDDYGHHPTEIRATLSALRDALPERRLIVFFQPHRYTRTQGLLKEFNTAFHAADVLFLTEIYPAGEKPIAGISSAHLLENIEQHGQKQVFLIPDMKDIANQVMPRLEENDIVLTLGAGNICEAGEKILILLSGEDS